MQDIQLAIELGVDLMKDIVAAGYSFLKEKNRERDFFGAATHRYVKNLLEDYGSVRVLGMEDKVPLNSLYVRANIIPKITSRSGILPEEMEQEREHYLSAFGRAVKTIDGEEIVNREQKFIVLGKPGAGKTTYLKYLTLRMISKDKKSQIKKRKLPIFITLREWADKKMPLLDFIVEQFDLCGFEEARPFVERVLANGDCLVLLDGLDEVSRDTRLDDIIQQVIDFTRKYRDSQFIASCRVAAYNRWFEKFKDVEIADFNEKQIEQFVRNFFRKEPKTAAECWEKLKNSKPLKEMASVPLLLTLLCITYNARQDFERNRALLYAKAIDALINRWDAERRIKRDKLYKALDETNMVNMLARIAAGYFEQNIYFFREEDLHRQIDSFLHDILGQDDKGKGKLVLYDIETQYGILMRRSEYAYSFAHLTFLEYFTAQYIVDKAMSGAVNGLVEYHFRDDRWLEIFLLTAGKLGSGAEELILLMQRKNRQSLGETPELNELLMAVQETILPRESKYPLVFRETIALCIACAYAYAHHGHRGFIRALAYALTYADDVITARDLVRVFILNLNLNLDPKFDFSFDLASDLDLDIDRDKLRAYGKDNKRTKVVSKKNRRLFERKHLDSEVSGVGSVCVCACAGESAG